MKMHGWGLSTMAGVGVLAAWFVACAGDTIPPIDEELRDDIEQAYPDEGGGGNGGSASANGGAAGAAGAAGAGDEGGAAGAGGGAPVGGGGSGGGGLVCDAYNDILVPTCGLSGCHNAGSSQGGFAVDGGEDDLVTFIDKPSTFDTCDLLYIDSANPDQSLILKRTDEEQVQGCGNVGQMPLGYPPLTPEETDCLTEWLTQFAD